MTDCGQSLPPLPPTQAELTGQTRARPRSGLATERVRLRLYGHVERPDGVDGDNGLIGHSDQPVGECAPESLLMGNNTMVIATASYSDGTTDLAVPTWSSSNPGGGDGSHDDQSDL